MSAWLRRILLAKSLPAVAFVASFLVIYGYTQVSGKSLNAGEAPQLLSVAHLSFALALLFFALGTISSFLLLMDSARRSASGSSTTAVESRPWPILGEPFLNRRGRRKFEVIFLTYFLVFSWATGILVIRPGQDFTATYGVDVPSVQVFTCCGEVGSIPVYVVYLAQGVGLLLRPSYVLLVLGVSVLGALSLLISIETLRARRATYHGISGAGLAGAAGFVAACPTCAGQVLLGALVGPSSVALAAAISPWQLYLATASIVILLAVLLAQARWIAKARQACRISPARGATTL